MPEPNNRPSGLVMTKSLNLKRTLTTQRKLNSLVEVAKLLPGQALVCEGMKTHSLRCHVSRAKTLGFGGDLIVREQMNGTPVIIRLEAGEFPDAR